MVRKLLLVSLGCLCVASAANAGNCRGGPCHNISFGADSNGCLEIRNSGRDDVEVTVYTTGSTPVTVHIARGDSEKVYKIGRKCVLAADYVRSDAQISGGTFNPSGGRDF
jgi:hypothetical protein